ncbi:MAG TPA: hypothetical protein VGF86_11190 [Candidatus Tumulicola sp.]
MSCRDSTSSVRAYLVVAIPMLPETQLDDAEQAVIASYHLYMPLLGLIFFFSVIVIVTGLPGFGSNVLLKFVAFFPFLVKKLPVQVYGASDPLHEPVLETQIPTDPPVFALTFVHTKSDEGHAWSC